MLRGALAGALIALAAVGYVAYPFWTLHRIEAAIHDRDVAALEALIDWPARRAGFKSDIKAVMIAAPADDGVALFGRLVTGALLDQMIDTYVTASWLARDEGVRTRLRERVRQTGFETLTRFGVEMSAPHADFEKPLTIVAYLSLVGFEWKLTRVRLPPELLQSMKRKAR